MKKYVLYLTAAWMLALSSFSTAKVIEDYSKTIDIFKYSPLVQEYFEKSYGYAVYPNVGKGAWLLGFAYGHGQVYRRGYVTGTSKLYHLSVGFQIGGQVFSEIIFFQDQRAYEEFTRGTFEFDAKAAAVAVTAGATAQGGSTGVSTSLSAGPNQARQGGARYVKGLAVFVQSKGGLIAEAALGGQRITFTPIVTGTSATPRQ
jgi:lipid-binding SYLF domain-containing protein